MTKIHLLYLITVCLIIGSCNSKNGSDNIEHPLAESPEARSDDHIIITRKQFDASGYQIGKLQEKELPQMLPVTGEIHLPERSKAVVSTYIEGRVGDINLLEGQWLSKGKRLFTISNPSLIDLQESYLLLRGDLEYMTAEYERLLQLSKEQLAKTKDVAKAKSLLQSTKAKAAATTKKLELYGINPQSINSNQLISKVDIGAPISGYVSVIDVVEGQYLTPSESAISIVNTNHMHLELSVLEKNINKLSKGQKVRFSIQGAPEQTFDAEIHLIQKVLDENRMVQVHCHLSSQTEKAVTAGMYVSADILLGAMPSLAIEEDGVVEMNGRSYILEVDSESEESIHLKPQEVEVVASYEGYRFINGPESTSSMKRYLTRGAYYVMVDNEGE